LWEVIGLRGWRGGEDELGLGGDEVVGAVVVVAARRVAGGDGLEVLL
jgi:hypothetical protein